MVGLIAPSAWRPVIMTRSSILRGLDEPTGEKFRANPERILLIASS
jgi:hypothetical protein